MQVAIGPEGTKTVVLNGSGGGSVQVGPIGARETWQPALASVSCSSNVAEANCKIYVGSTLPTAKFVDGTLSGSTGDSTGHIDAYDVPCGQYIFAVWAGGDAGAVATLTVSGTKDV